MKARLTAPIFSLLALVAMPLVGFASIPFWAWHFDRQIRLTQTESYAPDPGQFVGFGIVAGSVGASFLGALIGLGLVWLAYLRRERWSWLRVVSLLVNGFGALVGLSLLIYYLTR